MIGTIKAARLSGFVLTICCAVVHADPLSRQVEFNITSQRLVTAIIQFTEQARVQVISSGIDVTDQTTPGVIGRHTVADALNTLLKGTGLRYKAMNENTVSLQAIRQSPGSTHQIESAASTSLAIARADSTGNGHADGIDSSSANYSDSEKPKLTEIIVTAQKRNERLQDVPVPVTSIEAQSLVESNQLRLQDYFTSVPGLTVVPVSAQSQTTISIRGITTGLGNPTVGVTVDDVPFGSSTGFGGGFVVPDIDPSDLDRIEVLRGPQGTLYGASSMGGLVKFVTADPSTDAVSGRVQAGFSHTQNGAELGYNVRGSVNVPLSDTFAIRASAFTREDPGYIDNPVLHIDGVNEQHVYGGLVSALWRPLDSISLKVNALYQEVKGDGSNDVDVPTNGYVGPPLGDLQQNYIPGVGGYDRKTQAYSATLKAKLGTTELTAVSGYNVESFTDSLDYTYALGPYTQYGLAGTGFNGFGVTGSPIFNDNKTEKFTQEIRLAGPLGERFDWLVGAFYTHESSPFVQTLEAENASTGANVGQWLYSSFGSTYAEYAGFADLTFHVTDRFDVQLGGRESHIKQTYTTDTEIGPYDPVFLGAPSPIIVPAVDSNNNAFTYLLTPRFKLSPDLMLYARLASGYRPGGPNSPPAPGQPNQYNPDKTENYEIGIKADFLDRKLSIDTSVYYIDWKDIQLTLINPTTFFSYNANGSRAKSEGVELSIESKPLRGLTVAGWVVWNEAVLTESLPSSNEPYGVYGVTGDRLPYSARYSGNLSAEQTFPLGSNVSGFVGGDVSYVGDRLGIFTNSTTDPPSPALRQDLPAYAKTDLRAGVKYNSWTVNLFVNNVADKRGVLSGGLGNSPPYAFIYLQPRTAGMSFVKTF